MTPERLAALHRAAFIRERPWSAEEFQALLDSPFVQLHAQAHGFALSRTIAGESELLTLAVDPAFKGQGIGRILMLQFLADCALQADGAFLEVAADNTPATSLYATLGFIEIARRSAYYARKNAPAVDAIVMRRDLTLGQGRDSPTRAPESG